MKRPQLILLAVLGISAFVSVLAMAQPGGRRGGGGGAGFGGGGNYRAGVPEWRSDEQFKHDAFTFVRIMHSGQWGTDYPDADLNFSYRLHQLTSLEVDPNGRAMRLTDESLTDYPFIYFVEPGRWMTFSDAEARALRKYCFNGGFAMFDDFWGVSEYQSFYECIKRAFPDREPVELPLEHEIFHCVYDMKVKPQVPSIGYYRQGEMTERPDAPRAYYKGIFDDEGRMMVLICHNTDLGDGWEREGENIGFFKDISEKYSYPMGINIVTYAMTH